MQPKLLNRHERGLPLTMSEMYSILMLFGSEIKRFYESGKRDCQSGAQKIYWLVCHLLNTYPWDKLTNEDAKMAINEAQHFEAIVAAFPVIHRRRLFTRADWIEVASGLMKTGHYHEKNAMVIFLSQKLNLNAREFVLLFGSTEHYNDDAKVILAFAATKWSKREIRDAITSLKGDERDRSGWIAQTMAKRWPRKFKK